MAEKNIVEEQLQAQCFQWFWNTYPARRRTLFAVPNGGKRNIAEANRMKATGTVAGVSDLVWVKPGDVFFIELKTPTGKQSDEQLSFQQAVQNTGHRYVVVRSFKEFKELIEYYI